MAMAFWTEWFAARKAFPLLIYLNAAKFAMLSIFALIETTCPNIYPKQLPNIKGTVTRMCACAATWFLFWRTVFSRLAFGEEILFHVSIAALPEPCIDPETPEKAIILVFKSYLVHLGSFKHHILYFCASIVEKIRSHWGEPHEAMFVVVSVPSNGSKVAFNVVICLSWSFLSIKVLQSTIYLWRIFFKR